MTSPGMDFWASAPPVPLPVPGAQATTTTTAPPAVVFPVAPPVPVPAAPAPAGPPPSPGGFPFAPVTPGATGQVSGTSLPDVPAPLRALNALDLTDALTDFDEILTDPDAPPNNAAAGSRRSLRPRRTVASRVRTGIGELLITCAVITGLYVVWLVR